MSEAGECKRPVGKDPSSWGVEDVVWFIKDADPQALGPHAEAFRKHVSPTRLMPCNLNTKYTGTELISQHALGHSLQEAGYAFYLKISYMTAVAQIICHPVPCGPECKWAEMETAWILLKNF